MFSKLDALNDKNNAFIYFRTILVIGIHESVDHYYTHLLSMWINVEFSIIKHVDTIFKLHTFSKTVLLFFNGKCSSCYVYPVYVISELSLAGEVMPGSFGSEVCSY